MNGFITDVKGRVIGNRPESEHIVFEAPPLITQDRWDELQRRLNSANARKRKEMVQRNLDSQLESDGFDSAAYSQKRNS